MRKILVLLCCAGLAIASNVAAQDQGLTPPADALGGLAWQARFERDTSSLLPNRGVNALLLPQVTAQTLRLLGDYQFRALRLGDTGGLRLTGGLLIHLRPSWPGLANADNNATLPYAGIGYASASLRGEWGVSADLGLAAQGLGGLRLDRSFSGNSSLAVDGATRLLPMFRLGMNVAF